MSIQIKAVIICDSCGATLEGKVQTKSTEGHASYWDAKHKAMAAHWMINLRYGKPRHICPKCADGNPGLVQEKLAHEV